MRWPKVHAAPITELGTTLNGYYKVLMSRQAGLLESVMYLIMESAREYKHIQFIKKFVLLKFLYIVSV